MSLRSRGRFEPMQQQVARFALADDLHDLV